MSAADRVSPARARTWATPSSPAARCTTASRAPSIELASCRCVSGSPTLEGSTRRRAILTGRFPPGGIYLQYANRFVVPGPGRLPPPGQTEDVGGLTDV